MGFEIKIQDPSTEGLDARALHVCGLEGRRLSRRQLRQADEQGRGDLGEAGLAWRGRGESTPSQTAWALMALLDEAGEPVAYVFKTLADPFAGRINLFKVLSGIV